LKATKTKEKKMTQSEIAAKDIITKSINKGYKVDFRGKCAFIDGAGKSVYLDWSIPADGLIIEYYN
jgi:hypothetical protein